MWSVKSIATSAAAVAILALAGCAESATEAPEQATLNLSLNGAPASLDITQFGTGTNPLLMSMIYDRLAYSTPEGEIEPLAATGWEYSEDNTVLTITLREGMEFSNGNPVNAEAVKGTLERQIAAEDNTNPSMFASIASVDAVDDLTVVLNLSEPDPNLVTFLGNQVGLIADPSTFESDELSTNPVGSGPYVLNVDETVPDTKYVLDLDDAYWDADNMDYDRVILTVMTDPTATFNALRSGQLDVAPLAIDQVSEAENSGITISEAPYAQLGTMLIADRAGTDIPALGDVRVRQAINLIFDREAVVESLNQGVGEVTEQPFQPNSDAYVDALEGTYEFDTERAQSLMAEAGYEDGFAVAMPSVEGLTTAYEPTITQALQEINITVEWEVTPFSQIVDKILSGTMPLYYWPVGWNNMPTNLDVLVQPDGFFNAYQSSTPATEELLAAYDSAADADAVTAAYQDIATYLVEEAWFAPMFTIPNVYGANAGVTYKPQQIDLTDNIRYYSSNS